MRILGLLLLLLTSVGFSSVFTWQDAVRSAQAHNLELKSARETLIQSHYQIDATVGGLLPQLNVSMGASHSKSGSNTQQDGFSLGLNLTQLLYDGQKTQLGYHKAELDFLAASANYAYTSSTKRFDLRNTFISVYKYQKLYKLAKIIAQRREQQYELISLRYDGGVEHKGSVMNAKASLLDAQNDITVNSLQALLAQKKLAVEMGLAGTEIPDVPADILPATVDVNVDISSIAQHHPYYEQYVWMCQSRELSLQAAQANQGLSIYANAGLGLNDSQFFPQNNNWSIGLSASYPLWDWGQRQAQTNIAASQLTQTDFTEDNALRTVEINLETAQVNYRAAVNMLVVQKGYLTAAEERSKIAEAQYSTGQLTYDNWMIIENDYISNQRNVVNALANVLTSEAAWIEAKGGTLENEK